MRVLLVGPTGQVGGMIVKLFHEQASDHTIQLQTIGRREADWICQLDDKQQLVEQLNQAQADILVNAVAYTAVDKAESEPDIAFRLNAELPSNLADWCANNNCFLIHYSTDFVFDGQGEVPRKEVDATNPESVYGKTKLAGEKAIQTSTASAIILRIAWIYGETGQNFLQTMLRLGRERDSLGVVADQFGTPTYSRDVARATWQLIDQYIEHPHSFRNRQQLYHLTSRGETSWHGFAAQIFSLAETHEALALEVLNAISTADYPTPASRPAFSVLDCSAIEADYGIRLPDWKDSLAEAIRRLYQGAD